MTKEPDSRDGGVVKVDQVRNIFKGFSRLDEVTVSYESLSGATKTVKRLVVDHGAGVGVLPVDEARKTVLLVRQLRVPAHLSGANGFVVEVCAGLCDDTDTDPLDTAQREAREELGYELRDLRLVLQMISTPGILTERLHLYLAAYDPSDQISDGGGLDHEGEDIEVLEWSLDQAWQHVVANGLGDGKTIILLQALRLEKPHLFDR